MRREGRWRVPAAGAALCLAACLTLRDTAPAQGGSKAASNTALQQAVTRAMAGRTGTAVVVDVQSGQILAAYHPEVAARRLARPGSSIKTFTLLALLESGKVDANTALICKRPLTVGGHRMDCTHPVTRQPLDPAFGAGLFVQLLLHNSGDPADTGTVARLDSFVTDLPRSQGLRQTRLPARSTLAQNAEQLQLQAIGEWGVRSLRWSCCGRIAIWPCSYREMTTKIGAGCLPD